MLSAIRRFLSSQPTAVSLTELARHFDTREDVMDGMLSHWQRKGRLVRKEAPPCQKACGGCDQGRRPQLWYQWNKSSASLIPLRQLNDD